MRCYLGYNSKDRKHADRIAKFLHKNNIEVWFDDWSMLAGESIKLSIEDGIHESDAFIILMSPNSMSSKARYVNEEIRIALNRTSQDVDFRIFPVLLRDCEIHRLLQDIKYVDLRKNDDELVLLVNSINGIDKNQTEKPSASEIEFTHILHRLEFFGARGELTRVLDDHHGKTLKRLEKINRQITFAGVIEDLKSDQCAVMRSPVTPHQEKWTLQFDPALPAGSECSYRLEYTLRNSFPNKHELWTYDIESPVESLKIEFHTTGESRIETMKAVHIIGTKPVDEPAQPIRVEDVFVWEKLFPDYKDRYEFQFEWAD